MHGVRTAAAIMVAVVLVSGTLCAQAKFVGTKACAMCHKAKDKGEAFVLWQKSPHAGAFKTLESEASKKIAKEKGLAVAPTEAPECLKCHVTGGGTAKNVDKTFDMKEGVTCEACHGAASGYKTLHAKAENKAKAIAAGMIADEAAVKTCTTGHNEESPTFKGFKYDEYWAKIAHMLPKK